MFPYLVSWILISFATSLRTLCIARIFAGLSDGVVFTVIPMYLAEISEPKIRGFLSATVSISLVMGLLIINIIGLYLSIATVALICAIVPIIVFLTFIWVPESPYYYLIQNDIENARQSLTILGRYSESNLKTISEAIRKELECKRNIFDLVRVRSNRKALLISICLRTIQQGGGGSAFTFYTQEIFQKASNNNPLMNQLSTVIYFLTQLVACTCASFMVDKAGRKPLLIFSCIGAACALCFEGFYFYNLDIPGSHIDDYSWLAITVLVLYILVYSCGLSIIPITMIGEIFPTNVKGFALCLSDIYFAIIAETVSELFNLIKDKYGFHVLFWLFSLVCVLGVCFVYYFVPETKKKSLEEIQTKLKLGKKSKMLNNDNVILFVPSQQPEANDNTIPHYITHL